MIRFVPETGSTNADLLARLAAGERVPEGEWLVTDRQTAGRGRQGRSWSNGAGNFMGSAVIHPTGSEPPLHTLTLVASLALYETVLPFLTRPDTLMLKWPNDLLLGGAKLSGILLERGTSAVVLGIGVNLVQSPDLPDRPATNLAAHDCKVERDAFAQNLDTNFAADLDRWRTYGLEAVRNRWLAAAHPVGTPLTVHDEGGVQLSGQFAGLAEDCSLQLRLEDGSIRAIHAGDVMLA